MEKILLEMLKLREFNKGFRPARPVVVARVSFGFVQVVRTCDSYRKGNLQFVNTESENIYRIFEN